MHRVWRRYDYILDARSTLVNPDGSRDGIGIAEGNFNFRKFGKWGRYPFDKNPGWHKMIAHSFDTSPPTRLVHHYNFNGKRLNPGSWQHLYLQADAQFSHAAGI